MSLRLALTRSARPLRTPLLTPLQRRLTSTNPAPVKKAFRDQLYESTARRVQEERASQAQRVAIGKATGARPERISTSTLSALFSSWENCFHSRVLALMG